MRHFIYCVLDFAIRVLTRVKIRFAPPIPQHRYVVLNGYRRVAACEKILKDEKPWTVEEILAREG